MIRKFMNLDPEKRERIINAALKEFAQKGYKNASTNEIVKEANIAKGLLFHYFKNKKGLFLFLLDYSKDTFVEEFYRRLNYDDTDIIKRWRQIALLKMELIGKYPHLYEFLINTITDDSVEIKQDIENLYKDVLKDAYEKVLVNVDTSGFKDGIDNKRVSEIIIWVVQGFANSELEKLKHSPRYKSNFDIKPIMAEFDVYMELLKSAFYK